MTNQIIAFANQKGGVGKTTCCVNLASALTLAPRKRVLLCDLDPQGNASMGSGVDKNRLVYSMNDLLQGKVTIEQAIIEKTPAGYDLIAANSDLTAAEVILVKNQTNFNSQNLAKALAKVKKTYDYIFLDCPPSLNMLTVNALVACNAIMIAMQCEYFALEGMSDLISTMRQLQATINPGLHIGGIIRTMYDGRNRLALEVSNQLIEHFGNKVFQTVIPRNVRLAEAPSYGLPVHFYDKHSRGSKAYLALTTEFLKREKTSTIASKRRKLVN